MKAIIFGLSLLLIFVSGCFFSQFSGQAFLRCGEDFGCFSEALSNCRDSSYHPADFELRKGISVESININAVNEWQCVYVATLAGASGESIAMMDCLFPLGQRLADKEELKAELNACFDESVGEVESA